MQSKDIFWLLVIARAALDFLLVFYVGIGWIFQSETHFLYMDT